MVGRRKAVVPEGIFQTPLFSSAVKVGHMVYVSGTVALDQNRQIVGKDDFCKQAEFVFQSLQKILEKASSSMNQLVKVTIYLTDAANYSVLNEVWSKYVSTCNPPPARVTVVNSLVLPNLLIEIDAIATASKL